MEIVRNNDRVVVKKTNATRAKGWVGLKGVVVNVTEHGVVSIQTPYALILLHESAVERTA
jgi:hypothetical protein